MSANDSHQGLTAQQLTDFRETIETELRVARAKAAGPVPANAVCQREFNHGLETAFDFTMNLLDELLADIVTFRLNDGVADPDSGQTAN